MVRPSENVPSLAISVYALACPPVLCITLANLLCLYFACFGARGLCGRVGAAARSFKDGKSLLSECRDWGGREV